MQAAALGAMQASMGLRASMFERSPREERLTILHTNDTHSRIEPFPSGDSRHGGLGGAARRAALIGTIRREETNVLLVDAGDTFQGTPYFNFFKGELDYKLMSAMGYEASTVGNHDFDAGLEAWLKVLPLAKFPLITANYDFSRTILKGMFPPFKILRKGGIKIGIFGLGVALQGLVDPRLTVETRHLPPVPVAKEMVQELRRKKCHLILCLSHLGDRPDQNLARQVSGIDLILGGHTHTFMDQPDNIINPEGYSTLIHQVGFAGIRLGRIDLVFSRSKGGFAFLGSRSMQVDRTAHADHPPMKDRSETRLNARLRTVQWPAVAAT